MFGIYTLPEETVTKEDVRKYVVTKRSPAGCRMWLNKDGKWSYLRRYAYHYSAAEAARLAVDGATVEVAP